MHWYHIIEQANNDDVCLDNGFANGFTKLIKAKSSHSRVITKKVRSQTQDTIELADKRTCANNIT